MKIVIVGGHLSPSLAVLDALPKDAQVLFIGRKYTFEADNVTSLEYNVVRELEIPFASISTGRWQRKFTKHTIPSLLKIPYGFIQSFIILSEFKPDVILSFGGYLSVPVGLAAFFLRIPIVVHEQTLEAGLSNRILSFFADKICISWESSRKFLPREKTVLTGNPVRKFKVQSLDRLRIDPERSRKGQSSRFKVDGDDKTLPIIYISGGSSGSHFINTLVEGCLQELLEKYIIIHQTGNAQEYRDFDRLSDFKDSLAARLKARYHLVKFVQPQEVGSILERASLVVGRSGINTVTELIFFKKPAFLIPLPNSGNNEQIKNALFLKDKGLGEIFYQDTLDSKKFLHFIEEMFNNIERYKIRKPVQDDRGNAAQKIVEVIYNEAKIK